MKSVFLTGTLLLLTILAISQEKPLVVATASIFADMADNIAGGLVEVRSIVPIGGDPHIYEPTPADVQLVQSANLILKNGLTFEGWLNELIENSGTKANSVLITNGITPIESVQYKNSTDPHAWMSAVNGLIYLRNIKMALSELMPASKDVFEFNHAIYEKQLMDLDTFIRNQINSIPESKRILITSHDAFRYYGNEYGIRVESVLGTSTDADIQTSDIIRLNTIIKKFAIPAVFIESTVDPKLLKQLASDNQISIGGKLFSDSIGDEDSEAPTYLDMLKFNTKTIVKGLTQQDPSKAMDQANPPKGGGPYFSILIGVVMLVVFIIVVRNIF